MTFEPNRGMHLARLQSENRSVATGACHGKLCDFCKPWRFGRFADSMTDNIDS
ncbi:hypothetical protein Poly51_07210 [Rubripirellula tenax]|uniref:Uncharacterized protein n=1 Tax=Rubripirellula tenax TaxID=2528015 RepID=A0A5C6FI09_9BACT|nr:hypothetical protein Poly51_07210 [Rubripirellula tenax]